MTYSKSTWQYLDERHISYEGRKLLYFAGCDYLGMSRRLGTLQAMKVALSDTSFLSVSASRKTTGEQTVYQAAEQALSRQAGMEAALLTGAGYLAPLCLADHLQSHGHHLLIDERAHPCLQDLARLSGCSVHPYRHRDVASALSTYHELPDQKGVFLLSDGVFGLDGTLMPFDDLDEQLPSEVGFIVDDAHGFCCLGQHGQGLLEGGSKRNRNLLLSVSLSKALGCHGGAVIGTLPSIDSIMAGSKGWAGHTPLPPMLAQATLASLEYLSHHPELLTSLHHRLEHFNQYWESLGHDTLKFPVIALAATSQAHAISVGQRLDMAGIYAPLIDYPNASPHGVWRFSFSTAHTLEDVRMLAQTLSSCIETGQARRFSMGHGL